VNYLRWPASWPPRARDPRFGHTDLPEEQQGALRRAIRLELVTLAYVTSCVVSVFLVMGSSQAMKAAWIEDMLALIPPTAFLVAVSWSRRRPTADHPYGYHRAVATGHLTAAVALLVMGLFLIEDSATGLVRGAHPPIGTVELLGHTLWAGWLMIAVMVYTGIGPFILGRMKLPLSEQLHDKVLYADADMQKADWMTAAGTIVGVLGIGVGLWWADSAAALFIATSIVRDGWTNLRFAAGALMDQRARTFDSKEPHPLVDQVDEVLRRLPWVAESRTRVRDQGHVFHVEAFVRPHGDAGVERVEEAVELLRGLDWKINDVVVMPVRQLPDRVPAENS
jgi:cation diffusion facilitator family transporter